MIDFPVPKGVPDHPRPEIPADLSAEQWGRRQAASAPPWSDAKWNRVCAILRIDVAPS